MPHPASKNNLASRAAILFAPLLPLVASCDKPKAPVAPVPGTKGNKSALKVDGKSKVKIHENLIDAKQPKSNSFDINYPLIAKFYSKYKSKKLKTNLADLEYVLNLHLKKRINSQEFYKGRLTGSARFRLRKEFKNLFKFMKEFNAPQTEALINRLLEQVTNSTKYEESVGYFVQDFLSKFLNAGDVKSDNPFVGAKPSLEHLKALSSKYPHLFSIRDEILKEYNKILKPILSDNYEFTAEGRDPRKFLKPEFMTLFKDFFREMEVIFSKRIEEAEMISEDDHFFQMNPSSLFEIKHDLETLILSIPCVSDSQILSFFKELSFSYDYRDKEDLIKRVGERILNLNLENKDYLFRVFIDDELTPLINRHISESHEFGLEKFKVSQSLRLKCSTPRVFIEDFSAKVLDVINKSIDNLEASEKANNSFFRSVCLSRLSAYLDIDKNGSASQRLKSFLKEYYFFLHPIRLIS